LCAFSSFTGGCAPPSPSTFGIFVNSDKILSIRLPINQCLFL
jgi:hypothetical protein